MTEKLTHAQRETLRVMGDGEWYDTALIASEFYIRLPALIRRGLMERRNPKPSIREVRVTPSGRAVLERGE